jgi:hypothetical protein
MTRYGEFVHTRGLMRRPAHPRRYRQAARSESSLPDPNQPVGLLQSSRSTPKFSGGGAEPRESRELPGTIHH